MKTRKALCLMLGQFLALRMASSFLLKSPRTDSRNGYLKYSVLLAKSSEEKEVAIQLQVSTDNEKISSLFAWVCRAFAGDGRYNNLMLGLAAVYGDLPQNSEVQQMVGGMVDNALKLLPPEEEPCGAPLSQVEREEASLGAMGAGQWLGRWRTRPHALLSLHNISSVEEWEKSLPRGCRRTLKRAAQQNFTVTSRPIRNNKPAPHSTLAHFRCVLEHEIRLLAYSPEDFFDALAEGVSRYIGTTRMAGEIREYRDAETNQVIAFAHEVRKGRTIRGQWFYGNDDSSKRYVWFHSVRSLVERAIEAEEVDVVDLGPSGSDSFSDLKARYGFVSVADWPAAAEYRGPFWDYEKGKPARGGLTM